MFYSILTTKYLIDVADVYLNLTFGVAVGLSLFVFTASIVKELHNATEGKIPDYKGVIWTTVAVFFSFLIYKIIFKGTLEFCDRISFMMVDYQNWTNFIEMLHNILLDIGKYNLSSVDVSLFLTSLSLIIVVTAEEIFGLLRFILLAALYIVGPIVMIISIYKPTRSFFKKWLLLLLQVISWIIFLRIIQGIILSLKPQQFLTIENPGYIFILAAVIVLSYILIPIFTAKIVNVNNITLLSEIISTSTEIFKFKNVNIIRKTVEVARDVAKLPSTIFMKTKIKTSVDKEIKTDENVRKR